MTTTRAFFGSLLALLLHTPIALAVSVPNYHLTHQYTIGGDGDWDYLSIDSEHRRLYVSHGKQLEVLDADSGKVVGTVPGTPGVHGAALAPELNRGFSSNGGDSTVSIFDLKTLQVVRKVRVNRPDFILYDAFTQLVFPLNEKMTVLDAKTGDEVGEIELNGDPEAAVTDGQGTVYVSIADKAAIAVIDTRALKLVKTFPIQCTSPHSLAYDTASKRLLVGCTNGFRAVDPEAGKIVGGAVMCGGVDAGAFDPERKLVFESCSEGIVSVIHQLAPDTYDLVQSVPTQFWARTMAYDPKTQRIYLSTADIEWATSSDPTGAPHPRVRPGTFRVLVLEPEKREVRKVNPPNVG